MTIIYILAAIVVAVGVCAAAGATRPWVAQSAFAAIAIGSVATASKVATISDGVYEAPPSACIQ